MKRRYPGEDLGHQLLPLLRIDPGGCQRHRRPLRHIERRPATMPVPGCQPGCFDRVRQLLEAGIREALATPLELLACQHQDKVGVAQETSCAEQRRWRLPPVEATSRRRAHLTNLLVRDRKLTAMQLHDIGKAASAGDPPHLTREPLHGVAVQEIDSGLSQHAPQHRRRQRIAALAVEGPTRRSRQRHPTIGITATLDGDPHQLTLTALVERAGAHQPRVVATPELLPDQRRDH